MRGFESKCCRWVVVFTKGGDLCLTDKGILLKICEIGKQGDLSALICVERKYPAGKVDRRLRRGNSRTVQSNFLCNERKPFEHAGFQSSSVKGFVGFTSFI